MDKSFEYTLTQRPAASRLWRETASMVTAAARTPPVIMNLIGEGKANRSIPLDIDWMTRAPNRADQTLPRPPKRLVPPMTTEAITRKSKSPPPEDWFAAIRL